jgi:hypothetical protein
MFCSSCGHRNGDAALFCSGCGTRLTMLATPPVSAASFQPPPAALSQGPPADAGDGTWMAGYRLAGMGNRFIDSLMDSILIAAIFAVIGMRLRRSCAELPAAGFR